MDVPDSLFDELKKHYDTPAIVEISVFAACQNFNAKFNGALDTEINEFCPLPIPGVTRGRGKRINRFHTQKPPLPGEALSRPQKGERPRDGEGMPPWLSFSRGASVRPGSREGVIYDC